MQYLPVAIIFLTYVPLSICAPPSDEPDSPIYGDPLSTPNVIISGFAAYAPSQTLLICMDMSSDECCETVLSTAFAVELALLAADWELLGTSYTSLHAHHEPVLLDKIHDFMSFRCRVTMRIRTMPTRSIVVAQPLRSLCRAPRKLSFQRRGRSSDGHPMDKIGVCEDDMDAYEILPDEAGVTSRDMAFICRDAVTSAET